MEQQATETKNNSSIAKYFSAIFQFLRNFFKYYGWTFLNLHELSNMFSTNPNEVDKHPLNAIYL